MSKCSLVDGLPVKMQGDIVHIYGGGVRVDCVGRATIESFHLVESGRMREIFKTIRKAYPRSCANDEFTRLGVKPDVALRLSLDDGGVHIIRESSHLDDVNSLRKRLRVRVSQHEMPF